MKPKFISSYQGESEYQIGQGFYLVRHFANPHGSHTPEYWPIVRDGVGTIRAKHWPEAESFPPADVLACFPDFVGARVRKETGYAIEYLQDVRPVVDHQVHTGYIVAKGRAA